MASLITSIMGSSNSVALYVRECRRLGVQILPPDINESEDKFTVVNGKIRFGLKAVKNVGTNVIQEIVKTRELKGKFESFNDFCQKVDSLVLNKRQVESLIKCGAFDSLGCKRSQLMVVYEQIIDGVLYQKKRNVEGQVSLFDSIMDVHESSGFYEAQLPSIDEFSKKDILSMEKEMMGLYLSGHPLSEYEYLLDANTTTNCNEIFEAHADINEEEQQFDIKDGSQVIVGGIIIKKQRKITRNDNTMAFLTLEDLYGTIEIIVFPKIFNKYMQYINEDSIVLIYGTLNMAEEETPKIICNKIVPITEVKNNTRLYLQVESKDNFKSIKNELLRILETYGGNNEVLVYSKLEKAKMKVPKENWVNLKNKDLINKLVTLLGNDNVIIK